MTEQGLNVSFSIFVNGCAQCYFKRSIFSTRRPVFFRLVRKVPHLFFIHSREFKLRTEVIDQIWWQSLLSWLLACWRKYALTWMSTRIIGTSNTINDLDAMKTDFKACWLRVESILKKPFENKPFPAAWLISFKLGVEVPHGEKFQRPKVKFVKN